MIGLRSPRVLVLDDEFDNGARPLLDGLWQSGIPAVYCDGMHFPDQVPVKGLRLVFVDLHLLGGVPGHAQIQNTVAALKKIIDPTDGAIGLLLWTKHPEDQAQFQQALKDRFPEFSPAFTVPAERFVPSGGKIRVVEDPASVSGLFQKLESALAGEPGHWLLRAWEQQVHAAVCGTVSTVISVAGGDPLTIQARLSSSAGHLESSEQALGALFGSLHQVLSDSVDQISEDVSSSEAAESLWNAIAGRPRMDDTQRAVLNGVLLASRVPEQDRRALPGAVYFASDLPEGGSWSPSMKQIRGIFNDVYPKTDDSKCIKVKYQCEVKRLAAKTRPVLIELSPPCDAANDKRKQLRFVGGLLFPHCPDECEHLWPKGNHSIAVRARQVYREVPILVPPMSEAEQAPMHLVVSANFFFTEEVSWRADKQPAFRLREPVAADLQAWFASHAARPGFYCV